jgi:hypothetical protein
MSNESFVTTGVVIFSNLTEVDVYKGKPTGFYGLTIGVEGSEKDKLTDKGVKIKEYEPDDGPTVFQRKFKTKFYSGTVDLDGNPFEGEIPYGSKVRVAWAPGNNDPQNGLQTYLLAVRVIECAETQAGIPDDF